MKFVNLCFRPTSMSRADNIDKFYDNLFGTTCLEQQKTTPNSNLSRPPILPNLKIFHAIQENLSIRSSNAIKVGENRQLIVEAYIQSSILKSTSKTFTKQTLKQLQSDVSRTIRYISTSSNIFDTPASSLELLLTCLTNRCCFQLTIESDFVQNLMDEVRKVSQHVELAIRLISKLDPQSLIQFTLKYIEKLDSHAVLCVAESINQDVCLLEDKSIYCSLIEKCAKRFRHDSRNLLILAKIIRTNLNDVFQSNFVDKFLSLLTNLDLNSSEYEHEVLELNVKLLGQIKTTSQTINQILSRIFSQFHQKPIFIKLKTIDLLIEKFFSSQNFSNSEVSKHLLF